MSLPSSPPPSTDALQSIARELRARQAEGDALPYRVPAAWTPVGTSPTGTVPRTVHPHRFLLEHIEAILNRPCAAPAPSVDRPGSWVRDAVVYNVFVRHTSAYDHDGDGRIGTPDAADTLARTCNAEGVRETGTLLKTIALLGHACRLGATALHLLPITSVGRFGNKGALGSPYAIRNPYELEATLADPLVDADVDLQLRALVEACHHLGMRVIVEFVFRTASRDADAVATHPDWFYWILRDVDDRPAGADPSDPRFYGAPPFSADDLAEIKDKIAREDLRDLPPPPVWFRERFTPAPRPDQIVREADGRWTGTLDDGRRVHVPSAFADWPPDDPQPPWTDVTYLRLYNDPPQGPSFGYVAYNSIRTYDTRLAREENENTALWDSICGILPHYQRTYGVDGCMVDMGHALPARLMQRLTAAARQIDPDFALLSENFHIDETSPRVGYNAVVGYQFRAVESAGQMRQLVQRTCVDGLPVAAFGTAETHNTPRVAMRDRGAPFCSAVWMVNCFLPDTIPFIHAGFELGDPRPVNLGLAFTPDETLRLGQTPLGLFDPAALAWDEAGRLPRDIGRISALRQAFAPVAQARGPATLVWLDETSDDLLAFRRVDPQSGARVLVVADWRCRGPRDITIETGDTARCYADPIGAEEIDAPEGRLRLTLQPGEGRVLVPVG